MISRPAHFKTFLRNYTMIVNENATYNSYKKSEVKICTNSISSVYEDIYNDLNFLITRRFKKGISKATVAGIVMWRLYKSSPVKFLNSLACASSGAHHNVNFIISFSFVVMYILKIEPQSIKDIFWNEIEELEYQLTKRHINQESVALFFKVIVKALEKN